MDFVHQWATTLKTFFVLIRIANIFNETKHHYYIHKFKNAMSLKVARLWRRTIKNQVGETYQIRNSRRIRQALVASTVMNKDNIEQKAGKMMILFLHKAFMVKESINASRSFFKHIDMIALRWKNRTRIIKQRIEILTFLFDREVEAMKRACVQNLKAKKYKKMNIMLHQITPYQRKGVLQEYFKVCKYVFRLKMAVSLFWSEYKSVDKMREIFKTHKVFRSL